MSVIIRNVRLASTALLLTLALASCGGTSHPVHLEALARRCHEPQSTVAADLRATLQEAKSRGLQGSTAELKQGLETLARYVQQKGERPRCRPLLRALVDTVSESAK
jgi:CII-binding regulator of phage lambda lysogenization HflD